MVVVPLRKTSVRGQSHEVCRQTDHEHLLEIAKAYSWNLCSYHFFFGVVWNNCSSTSLSSAVACVSSYCRYALSELLPTDRFLTFKRLLSRWLSSQLSIPHGLKAFLDLETSYCKMATEHLLVVLVFFNILRKVDRLGWAFMLFTLLAHRLIFVRNL